MISDETLSAFLDAELPEADMQRILAEVQHDPNVAIQLARLCSMDACVRKLSRQLDEQPLPTAVTELLHTNITQPKKAWWQQSYGYLQQHAAAVASVALVAGLLLGYHAPAEQDDWPMIASTLEQSISGQSYMPAKHLTLTPTLAFINHEQQLCRHYQQHSAAVSSEHLACKQGSGWQLVASAYQRAAPQSDDYQLASHQSALDSVIDRLGVQSVLTLQQEQAMQQTHR